MTTALAAAKAQMRQALRERLAACSPAERQLWSNEACARLIATPRFLAARSVFAFVSIDPDHPEVLTTELLHAALSMGKRLCVPKIGQRRAAMRAVAIESLERDCAPGYFGLLEPRGDQPVPADELDLIVAPGLAFDLDGGRLGQGGGYYDRFLAETPRRVDVLGLGFECQLVERVPRADFDQPIGGVATQAGVHFVAGST